jgi:putative endopeptidase
MRAATVAVLVVCSLAAAQESGRPQYGSWGFDLSAMNRSVNPGDDFFDYADGTWIERATIPADKSAITHRIEMTDRVVAQLHDLLESSAHDALERPTDLRGKVGAFYKAFMDQKTVEQLGFTPIARQLAAVRTSKTPKALAALMGLANLDFEQSLFDISIDVDLKNPTHYAVYLSQSGLGLPDRDYYLESGLADKKADYQAYVSRLLDLVQWPEAAQRARDIVYFEGRIAEVSWSRTEDRDVNATYNPMSLAELQHLAPEFPWKELLRTAHLESVHHVIVNENTAFPRIAALFAQTPIETLQAWQAFHIIDNAAPYLSAPFVEASFEMHQRSLSGQQEQSVRWKRGIAAVGGTDITLNEHFGSFGTMSWGVGQLYSAQYFPPAAKAAVNSLVDALTASYRARLEKLDWMSDATRAEAIRKLETYSVKIGYPDHPRDYSGLDIRSEDLAGDVRRAALWDWMFNVKRLPQPVDRSDWVLTPQTNNAYNGDLRDIQFPAAILQPPMFDLRADAAINYGAIGAVIGHELTHGFDDQGRKIDASGALRDWWTAADAATFTTRAALLAHQYSLFQPLSDDPSVHVNGELTLGENIADLGGLTLALDAYQHSLGGQADRPLDGFSGVQRVFLGWAQAWCGKLTEDAIRKQVVSDPHSPRGFRVDGVVRNIDSWYTAFDVKPTDKLYLAPDQRVHIW